MFKIGDFGGFLYFWIFLQNCQCRHVSILFQKFNDCLVSPVLIVNRQCNFPSSLLHVDSLWT
jgi:hypothetical protein